MVPMVSYTQNNIMIPILIRPLIEPHPEYLNSFAGTIKKGRFWDR